jgi:hypothetical protein
MDRDHAALADWDSIWQLPVCASAVPVIGSFGGGMTLTAILRRAQHARGAFDGPTADPTSDVKP